MTWISGILVTAVAERPQVPGSASVPGDELQRLPGAKHGWLEPFPAWQCGRSPTDLKSLYIYIICINKIKYNIIYNIQYIIYNI